MPNVKGKKYPYTPQGMMEASKASRGLSRPMNNKRQGLGRPTLPSRPMMPNKPPMSQRVYSQSDDQPIFEYGRDPRMQNMRSPKPGPGTPRPRPTRPMKPGPMENRGGSRRMGTPSTSRLMSGRKKY